MDRQRTIYTDKSDNVVFAVALSRAPSIAATHCWCRGEATLGSGWIYTIPIRYQLIPLTVRVFRGTIRALSEPPRLM
jgi:hypothetical protein